MLMYHHVSPLPGEFVTVTPDALEEHARILSRRPTLFLDELVRFMEGNAPLPKGAVVVTFDDGYADFARWAAPILARHGVKSTVFICPGLMAERRDSAPIEPAYHGEIWRNPTPGHFLAWEEVSGMQASGLVRFGSHTMTHPRRLDERSPEELRDELAASKRVIEKRLGAPCEHLAWPRGVFTAEAVEMARELGYRSASTTRRGPNRKGGDPMAIRRFPAVGEYAGCGNRLEMRRRLFIYSGVVTASVWSAVSSGVRRRRRARRRRAT